MAAPTIEGASDSGTASSATGSITINLGTNANRALWAQLADVTVAGNTITALTLDGVDILSSLVGPTALGTMNVYNLHHVTSLTGSKVLTATWVNLGFKSVIGVALSGADQTSPFSDRQTQYNASSTSLSLTVASSTNSLVLLATQEANGATLTPGAGSSVISGISGSFRHGLQEAGAASVSIGGTWSLATTFWASGVSALGVSGGSAFIPIIGRGPGMALAGRGGLVARSRLKASQQWAWVNGLLVPKHAGLVG